MEKECLNIRHHIRKENRLKTKFHIGFRNVTVSKNTVVLAIYLILIASFVTSSTYSSKSGNPRYVPQSRSPYRSSTDLKKGFYSRYLDTKKPKTIFRQTFLGPNVCGSKCCSGYSSGGTAMCITPICPSSCKNRGHCIRPGKCLCLSTYTGRDCSRRKYTQHQSMGMTMHKRNRGPRQTLIHYRYSGDRKNTGSSSNSEVVCTPTTCFNGGTCVDGSCICRRGYAGKKCEKVLVMQMNSASPSEAIRTSPSTRAAVELCNALCVHGKCVIGSGDAPTCQCFPGYTGTMCESLQSGGINAAKTSVANKVSSGMQYSKNLLRPVAYVNARRIAVPTPRIAPTRVSKYGKCYRRVGGNRCGLSFSKYMSKQSCCRAGLGDAWGPSCSPCRKRTYLGSSHIETKASRLSRITCPSGFVKLNGICKDVNECSTNQHLCSNGVCKNSRGSYWCMCNRGYHQHVSRTICLPDRSSFRRINAISQNQCYLDLDYRGGCSKGFSVATGSKSICCCSVGKAWGTDCEKCPTHGTIAYRRLCPNGAGYLNSVSYALSKIKKPSTVRYQTKTTKPPIIIPSLTKTDRPTTSRDKTVLPTSKTNDNVQTSSKINYPKTQTIKTTQTTTTPLTSTTSTQATTTHRSTTTTTTQKSTTSLPDTPTTTMAFTTTTTEYKGINPPSSTTVKSTTISTSSIAPGKSTSTEPKFDQTPSGTISIAIENLKTVASSTISKSLSTSTLKQQSTVEASTEASIIVLDNEIQNPETDEAVQDDAMKTQFSGNTNEDVTTALQSTTPQRTAESVKSTLLENADEEDDFNNDFIDLEKSSDTKEKSTTVVQSTTTQGTNAPAQSIMSTIAEDVSTDKIYAMQTTPTPVSTVTLKSIQSTSTKKVDEEEINEEYNKNHDTDGLPAVDEKVMVDKDEIDDDEDEDHGTDINGSPGIHEEDINELPETQKETTTTVQSTTVPFKSTGTEEVVKEDGHGDVQNKEIDIDGVPETNREAATTTQSTTSQQTTSTAEESEVETEEIDYTYNDIYGLPDVEITVDIDGDIFDDDLEPTEDLLTTEQSNENDKNGRTDIVEPELQDVGLVSSESKTSTESSKIAISLKSDACSPNPCQNNGDCTVEEHLQFKCKCSEGYFGTTCDTRDYCVPDPCKNGAKCETGMGYYYCDCLDGFVGKDCERERVPKCQSNPCLHGACMDIDDVYKCECGKGYQGIQCNQDVNECENIHSCIKHSECINTEGSFKCVCLSGFRLTDDGLTCEDVNECDNSSMCENGNCVNIEGSYECDCFIGYKLDHNKCEDLNECEFTDCGETAECHNVVGGFQCVCPDLDGIYDMATKECNLPFTEATKIQVSEIRKPCYSDPQRCESALSTNSTEEECCCTLGRSWGDCDTKQACPSMRSSAFKDTCPVGRGATTGENNMRVDLNECELFGNEKICRNGQCQNSFGAYECVCYKGFYYNRRIQACDDMNECRMRSKCINGFCINTPGSFRCQCPAGTVLRRSGPYTACIGRQLRRRRPSVFTYRQDSRNDDRSSSSSEFKDSCYTKLIFNARCGPPPENKQTYKDCCCGRGVAWGRSCSKCPQESSGDYTFLCQNQKPKVATLAPPVRLDKNIADVDTIGGFHEQKCEIPGGCENGKCLRTVDGYTCQCYTGFQLDEDLTVCIDINECEELDHVCQNGECINQQGTFSCDCHNGFEPTDDDLTLCKPVESDESDTSVE